ncbi:putative isochorismatase [Yersinia enterocolitica]|nr:putative isochorismatase [Yersinia enterocolitica]
MKIVESRQSIETKPSVAPQQPVRRNPGISSNEVILNARPEPIAFPTSASALIVVDMQNAYTSEGGISTWLDLMFQPPLRLSPISNARSLPRGSPVFR